MPAGPRAIASHAAEVAAEHGPGRGVFRRQAWLGSLVRRLCTQSRYGDAQVIPVPARFTELLERLAAADSAPVRRRLAVICGQCRRNPALSVPELHASVGTTYDLPPDAVALYLQLLAFPDPTDQHVQRWNGWPADRRKKARCRPGRAGEAPRARRTEFIPGEWRDSGKGALPMERYKESTRGVWVIPELFQAGWELRGGTKA